MHNKSITVGHDLRRRMQAGEFLVKLPGQRALADHYQVNVNTIRRVIGQLKRERLIQPRQGSGFYLADGQHSSIGLAAFAHEENFFTNYYYQALSRSILQTVAGRGDVFAYQFKGARQYACLFHNWSTVNGVLVFTPDDDGIRELCRLKTRIPFVVIGSDCRLTALNNVTTDNLADSQAAVTRLVREGHRRIIFLGGGNASPPVRLRLQGYRSALREQGLPLDPALELNGAFPFNEAGALLRPLLEKRPRATALFGVSRIVTRQALEELGPRARSLRVLVYDGFDLDAAPRHLPRWLELRQPLEKIGRLAISYLYQLMAEPQKAPLQTMLHAEIIEQQAR